jgi:RNA polymerase sigma factor (sigma-70 family)
LSTGPTKPTADLPKYLYHESFPGHAGLSEYGGTPTIDDEKIAETYMPDEVTRDLARRMHYAGWRVHTARKQSDATRWRNRYYDLRDKIVLGNRKLVFRAVRRCMATSNRADDLIGDCHIVLIQAIAAYNPWMGIRFSTYAFTCLIRALSRLSQRLNTDWLSRSLPLDAIGETESGGHSEPDRWSGLPRLDIYLRADHPLLTDREKAIIGRRFNLTGTLPSQTLERVGKELGLSKERVRQVQATALDKLRAELTGSA